MKRHVLRRQPGSLLTSQLLGVCSFFLIACPLAPAIADEVLEIGSRRELFVDDYLVERLAGLRLKLHEPRPTPLVPGTPNGHYATVIKDGSLYRRYDRGGFAQQDGDSRETTHYWESRDGIHWSRPNLGLFEVNGSRDNNVIIANTKWVAHNFSPFLDRRPQVPKEQRFKALAGDQTTGTVSGADQ